MLKCILYWQTKGIGQTESVDSDPCKWAVWFRKRGGAEIYLLKASSPETKELWIKTIKECHDKKRPGLLKGLLRIYSLFALTRVQNKEL